ncbi:rhodanese-like domain-containing protein [Thermodesulfobacteriota bacterium]
MAQKFISMGYKKVYVLIGGWKEWAQSLYPVQPK